MDYEIRWVDEAVRENAKAARLDVDGWTFIDVLDANGDYLDWCAHVKFSVKRKPSKVQRDRVMQTVLMMARARYGL